jgi:hypothetical protein
MNKGQRHLIEIDILAMGAVEKNAQLGYAVHEIHFAFLAQYFFYILNLYLLSRVKDNIPVIEPGQTGNTAAGTAEENDDKLFEHDCNPGDVLK